MDNLEKFTGKAQVYQQARPAYAGALIEYLKKSEHLGPDYKVADIGSGTGIFSQQLLSAGATVYGVEPNQDMRNAAEEVLTGNSHFFSINGTDAHTGLGQNSMDMVTAAQAFHWFNIPDFRLECTRILKPGSKVILVWNMRNPASDFNQENARIFQKFCPKFRGFSGGINERDDDIREFYSGTYEILRFENSLEYERQHFISRALSASYSLVEGQEGYPEYLLELQALFDKYARNGVLTMPNETVAYIGPLEPKGMVIMKTLVRPARLEDAEAITLLNKNDLGYDFPITDTRQKLEKLLADPHYKIWVAESGGQVIGYVQAEDYDTLYEGHLKNILGIAVSHAWQGKGVGRKLLERVEEWGRETGALAVRLVSRESRTAAHAFYYHCGYFLDKKQLNIKKRL